MARRDDIARAADSIADAEGILLLLVEEAADDADEFAADLRRVASTASLLLLDLEDLEDW